MKTVVLALMLATAAAAATAAPIYKCGPDGKTYSQTPCAEGRIVEASDPRTAAQRAEAKRVVAQERKTADALARERHADAKAGPEAAGAASLSAPPAPSASSSERGTLAAKKSKPKAALAKDFVAVAPAEKKAKNRK